MTRPLVLLLALASVSQAGCGNSHLLPREPDPLPLESADAAPVGVRVEGVVTDRYGYRVPNALITVRVGSPLQGPAPEYDRDVAAYGGDPAAGDGGGANGRCGDASHLPTRTRTGPTGDFSVVVEAGRRPPFRACLEVEAIPPARLPWRENIAAVPVASFEPISEDAVPSTVRVHVVLY